ncbi:hypothetical protein, partial [Nocardioides abyssi]
SLPKRRKGKNKVVTASKRVRYEQEMDKERRVVIDLVNEVNEELETGYVPTIQYEIPERDEHVIEQSVSKFVLKSSKHKLSELLVKLLKAFWT